MSSKPQFIITENTTYQETIDFLNKDKEGLVDLVFLILKQRPDIRKQIKEWSWGN